MLEKKYFDGVETLSLNDKSLKKRLREIVHKVRHEHPAVEEVILFGSFAKDDYTPYSDIDITIILSETKKRFIERQDDFIDYFSYLPFDVNLIIYTRKEFQDMLTRGNNFIREVRRGMNL